MRQIATESLVLHLFDYRETSRIVRLVTRDAGVLSVVARGARRPRNRFGAALDLFTSGTAQVALHATGDLHALQAFDAAHARPSLARSLDRFGGASALAELCLRFGGGAEGAGLHDAATAALDALGAAADDEVGAAALAGAWQIVGELGLAPSLAECASCHAALTAADDVTFHHRAGGALCPSCARDSRGGRRLPAAARATLVAWMGGGHDEVGPPAARSHARLLREFLEEHLGDGRPLRALVAWEERLALAPAAR